MADTGEHSKVLAAKRRIVAYFKANGIECAEQSPYLLYNKYREIRGLPLVGKKTAKTCMLQEYENDASSVVYKGNKAPKKLSKRSKDAEKKQKKVSYNRYMKSDKWISFRAAIIAKRGRICEDCGKTSGTLHAHHLTYERFGNELESDIQLLCVRCHEKKHNRRFAKRRRR